MEKEIKESVALCMMENEKKSEMIFTFGINTKRMKNLKKILRWRKP